MRIFKDSQPLIIEGEDYGEVRFEVTVCWYLYPQVFILNEDLKRVPSVEKSGFCYPSVPNKLQRDWLFKCLCSYKKFKRTVLLPYFANLRHYQLTGEFSTGQYTQGVEGIKEFKRETK